MAHALQIDTLAFTKKLREAGAEEGLAEAIVEGLSAADTSELATKSDVLIVENKIVEMKADILKWMFGAIIAQTGIILAVVKFL